MAIDPYEKMNDDEFFYARMKHYHEGVLPEKAAARFETIIEKSDYKGKVDLYLKQKVRLSVELESVRLSQKHISDIRNLVQGASVMTEEEQREIEEFASNSKMVLALRLAAMIVLFGAAIGFGVWKLMPSSKGKFEPLYYLSYESLALQEDPSGRMDLLTDDMNDVETYFAKYPAIDFKVQPVKPPEGWSVKGATMIDYDFAKVAAILYTKADGSDSLVQFFWKAEQSGLPASPEAKEGDFTYSSYTSESLNMIAFRLSENRHSLLVGRNSAVELAKIALAK